MSKSSRVIPPDRLRLHSGPAHLEIDGAEARVLAGGGGLVGDQVLGAQLLFDGGVDAGQLTRIPGEEGAAARLLGEAGELALLHLFPQADRVDRDAGPSGELQRLLPGEAAPLVLTVREQEEGPPAFETVEGVEGEDQ